MRPSRLTRKLGGGFAAVSGCALGGPVGHVGGWHERSQDALPGVYSRITPPAGHHKEGPPPSAMMEWDGVCLGGGLERRFSWATNGPF